MLGLLLLCGMRGRAEDGRQFSFAVFGDNQFATASPTSGVPERMAIPEAVRAAKPTFLLHTGDLMDHGRDAEAYDRFVEYYAGMLAEIAFFPTMGNHDAGYKGIRNYRAFLRGQLFERNREVYGKGYETAFDISFEDDATDYPERYDDPRVKESKRLVPSGVTFKTFYAFRFRNVYVVSLEQGTRWWANTPLAWLESHLERARSLAGVDHVVVIMHHPMYSTTMCEEPPNPAKPGSGECIRPVRRLYEDLFRKHDVTLVFSGHAHLYEHFYVPDNADPTRDWPKGRAFPHDGEGVHYVVTGGGGGRLNGGHWRDEYSARFLQAHKCAYHFTLVEVNGAALTVTAHGVQGTREDFREETFDRFEIAPSQSRAGESRGAVKEGTGGNR